MSRFVLIVMFILPLFAKGQSTTVAEQYLFSAINQERLSRDLPLIRLNVSLQQAAAFHAQQMAARGTISHRLPGEPELSARGFAAGTRFQRITENVAEGPTVLGIQDAWMRSTGHRANILDPAVDAVGISAIVRRGQIYAVEDFARVVSNLPLQQQEAAVAVQLEQAGLELVSDVAARKSCSMASGYAGFEQPAFLIRYTTADLSQLPTELQTRLASGRDHRAAVGACPSSANSPFSSYSLAVVLYP